MNTKYILNTDGGSRGNPGPAAIGGILKDSTGVIILEFKERIGEATNNFAEYTALMRGLELAVDKGVADLACFLDSELVVKQLNGQYRVKDNTLREMFSRVIEFKQRFNSLTFAHVRREQNSGADRLVNEALDAA
jgi:ribonuclease HI